MGTKDLQLGPLEMDILGYLQEGEARSVGDVQERLARDGKKLAYTTVMTVMTRLHEKGVLSREKMGRQFLYSPARGFEKTRQSMLRRVHRSLFKSRPGAPIAKLLEEADDLDVEELKELRRLVDQKLREKSRQ